MYDRCTKYSKLYFLVKFYHTKFCVKLVAKQYQWSLSCCMMPLNMLKFEHQVMRQRNSLTSLVLATPRYIHALKIVCYIGGKMKIKKNAKYAKHLGGNKMINKLKVVMVQLLPSHQRNYPQKFCDIFHWFPSWKDCSCLQRYLRVWFGMLMRVTIATTKFHEY